MFASYSLVILSLVYAINCEKAVLPEYIEPCDFRNKNFTECLKEQIEIALPKFTKGISELDVPSIDPVHLSNIAIDGNGLNLSFSKAALHGLSKSKLTKLDVDLGKDKSEERFSLSFKGNLSLTAQYTVDGKILILPIIGNGDALVVAQGIEVGIDSKVTRHKDESGEHFKLATPKYKYTIERTTFDLKNLFNGNKELAETTLRFANENWQQLMDELSPPVVKQIVRTVVKAINKFFSKFTIEQMIKGYYDTPEN